MRCPIKFCYNSRCLDKTGLKWYSFPTQNESLRSLWLKACGKSEIGKCMKVCSAHFDDEDFPADTRILRMLKRDAVPKGRSLFHYFILILEIKPLNLEFEMSVLRIVKL